MLTTRTNGSSGSNIITASWFNDFKDLLTGVMQDQEVTIKNLLVLQAIGGPPAVAPTAAPAAGAGMGIGLYNYAYTFVAVDGESTISPVGSMTTTTGNQQGNVSAIAVGPTGTTARKLYRTVVGGGASYKLVTTINDNTTTTYLDITADGSLGVAPPTSSSFGGALIIKDQSGVVKFKLNNDGTFSAGGSTGFGNTTINGTLTVTGTSSLDNGNITTDGLGNISKVGYIISNVTSVSIAGTTNGTATAWMDFRGTIKRVVIQWVNFKNGATTNTLILPVGFTNGAQFVSGDQPGITFKQGSGGSLVSGNLQTGFGTNTTTTNFTSNALGDLNSPFDRIVPTLSQSLNHNGWVTLTGV